MARGTLAIATTLRTGTTHSHGCRAKHGFQPGLHSPHPIAWLRSWRVAHVQTAGNANLASRRRSSPLPVRRLSAVALDAVEPHPEPAAAALRGNDPRAALPWRVMTDVLVVPTLQFGDPVPFLVLVEARDLTFHRNSPRSLSGRVARLLGLVLGKRPGRCHCANHLGLPVLDDRNGQAAEQLVSGLMRCPSLQGACSVLRVPGSHRLPKALPVGMPQMFRDDDVQGAADRFLRQITKEFGRGAVPELNHSLSICKDDPIRGLLDDESEQVKALRAGQHRASLRNMSDA